MRVALVIERFLPRIGGVENVAWRVAEGLAQAGDEVHVVARRADPRPDLTWHPVRVPAFWQPLRVLAFSHLAARALGMSRRGLQKVLKRHGLSRETFAADELDR